VSEGEDRLLHWLRRRLRRTGRELLGDDAALLPQSERWAVSVDQQIEGVHFPAGLDPRWVGRRLAAVCLSDLAASGAEPAYGFLTVALPDGFDGRRLLEAVVDAAERHGLTIAGGDLASTAGPVATTLTVLGRRFPRGRWLRRAAARPGDAIWVGGTLGESALGRQLVAAGARPHRRSIQLPPGTAKTSSMLRSGRRAVRRHLAPEPQIELGRHLGRRRRVAAIDVSDGLALDLSRLCRESGVGARVERDALPVPASLPPWAAALGLDPWELALSGGEDYVLLFTLPPGAAAPPSYCTRIGAIVDDSALELVHGGGTRALTPLGWDHLARRR
jgi:thiamine-monophosphate kinase